jgi:type VI secretion system protein VasG
MLNVNLAQLIAILEPGCRQALEDSAASCMGRGSHEIGVEDYVEKLIEQQFDDILIQFNLSYDKMAELLKRPGGKSAQVRPVFSTLLVEFLQEAFLLNSLELHRDHIDKFTLALVLLKNPARYGIMKFYKEFGKIPAAELQRLMEGLDEDKPSANGRHTNALSNSQEGYLKKYAIDFIEEAKQGRIDPVFARNPETRQMVDILSRRRKNNPILVGDPGVGKTAVVEGLAVRILEKNVPVTLQDSRIIGLDMGRLQAGASVKGEFEKRLKGVIDEVKASPVPTILFIDEAHTLVGSGNEAGGGDGANLLKPALARGELRTIAATTWSEYKKYFEKDAALARRFQLVKLDQPSLEETATILRGIVPHYEKNHGVYIRDDAVLATTELSTRYISGRQQPDKAIDVLDTACARVRVSLGAKPARLEEIEEALASRLRESDALERDQCKKIHSDDLEKAQARHAFLKSQIADLSERIVALKKRWEEEKKLVESIIQLRIAEPGDSQPQDAETVSESMSLAAQIALLRELQQDEPLVFYEVNPQLVASIISEWTGIPIGKLTEKASGVLSNLQERLRSRIKGQDHALVSLEKAVLASRTGMNNPTTPTATFLLVGPSGVGKTETALAMADELYGGERMLISINMSEFQEKHTISRLIGSPPGYVGYGEGGRLTEAVRRQPYSVVLFDEVEKAHPDLINLFYQIFDKGILSDGEGRDIDFRNTMIFLTSNLGSDAISSLYDSDKVVEPVVLRKAITPALSQFFKPALLGRMTIIPYTGISPSIMKELVSMKLARVATRLLAAHNITLIWGDDAIDSIAASCTAVETGARNIDHIINDTLLPEISNILLGIVLNKKERINSIAIGINTDNGKFTYTEQ